MDKKQKIISLIVGGSVMVLAIIQGVSLAPAKETAEMGKVTPIEGSIPVDGNVYLVPAVKPALATVLPGESSTGTKKPPDKPGMLNNEAACREYEIEGAITPSENPLPDTGVITYSTKHKYAAHKMNFHDDPGQTNAIMGCAYLNGAMVMPGEVFSFNGRVGPRTESRGFVAGKSVINGKLEPDVGGGVCRLSTALHQAVMQA
ncbi:VanW family protein, partial [Desulfocucumis palustris]|uniref:VanW family protein n=1 Tax=Desulfocucumis palustris TaxID=1898651 RepID=UPI0013FDEAB6